MHQDVFEEIKNRLLKPLILHSPVIRDRFQLLSDISKTEVGSSLYQIQNWITKFMGYTSKRLPPLVANLFNSRFRIIKFIC